MLENTPVNNREEKRKRKIIFIIIGIICALAIIVTIVIDVIKLSSPQLKVEEKPEEEIRNFSSVFDNKLNTQGFEVKQFKKVNEEKQIVYTVYKSDEKSEGKYDIDVKLPAININNEKITEINKEILSIFKAKAQSIMGSEEENNIIYNVEYTAYINSNILSVVIKSNLKEGQNAQRVIVKAYTYNMTSGELIGINEMLAIKQLDKNSVKKQIDKVVLDNAKQNENLKNLGYKIYERDLSSKIYKIENINNFFYGPDGALYIIFAYGNNNFTAEMDVITIQ